MDENKIYDLLEKVYIEVQDTKGEVKTIKGDIKNIKSDVETLKIDVRKLGIKIDEEVIPIQNALLDGYHDNAEHIEAINDKIDNFQIDVNSLTAKTAYNDTRIIEMSKDFKRAK